jgi:prephenate dehydrogenase
MKRVVLVGLGLIGGSVGQALRERLPSLELVGIDRQQVLQPEPVRCLLDEAIATDAVDASYIRSLDADLVVLAAPVGVIIKNVRDWLESGVPLTDCGSTKRSIVAAAEVSPSRHWFVPGHPMAGRERGGFESASGDLFQGRRWLICPQCASAKALGVVKMLVKTVGAHWTEMTPEAHDFAVAMTSHLPQLLASWLAASTSEQQRIAAGPAFADMTRIAGGSELIWKDIFKTNAEPLAAAARKAAADLLAVAEDLEREVPALDKTLQLLAKARRLI